jgi:3-dehydroquinate dehydratase-2
VKVLIINGPNLNLVGKREPDVYGSQSLEVYLADLTNRFNELTLSVFQSNIEGEIVTALQEAENRADGIILNAGGYSHTSVAIADAVAAISKPVIEVHISNIYAREPERHVSLISKYARGCIVGLGLHGYELALRSLVSATTDAQGS